MSELNILAEQLEKIMDETAPVVMAIYAKDFSVYTKDDQSAMTEADLAANEIICQGLKAIADYPILSEEGKGTPWSERQQWQRYWLVDPIDGTKEFIKKSGEFTINIALIEGGIPVLGVVDCPAINSRYIGINPTAGDGAAFKINAGGARESLSVGVKNLESAWRVVGSRSHNSAEALELAESLGDSSFFSMGSSLKLCAIAEDSADIYPRFGLTSEWDTAAAQAVVEAAGGQVVTTELTPLRYNQKDCVLNPYFIVCKSVDQRWARVVTNMATAGKFEH